MNRTDYYVAISALIPLVALLLVGDNRLGRAITALLSGRSNPRIAAMWLSGLYAGLSMSGEWFCLYALWLGGSPSDYDIGNTCIIVVLIVTMILFAITITYELVQHAVDDS